ncbi:MAG TPA: hypothetical protein VF624_05270 [Tepidisphaeraceae bacterium]|jgi:hypothetical protein
MHEFLAQPPWYLPIVAALVAVVLLFQGNARQNRRLKWAGLALALVAVAVVALGHLLESDSEQVVRRTEEIVAAVNDRDWKAFAARLDPDVRFFIYNGREQFAAGAAKTVEAVGVKNVSLSGFVVTPEPGAYRVDFRAMSDVDVAGRSVPTNWRFFWSREPGSGAFLLYNVENVPNAQFGGDAVTSRLVRP